MIGVKCRLLWLQVLSIRCGFVRRVWGPENQGSDHENDAIVTLEIGSTDTLRSWVEGRTRDRWNGRRGKVNSPGSVWWTKWPPDRNLRLVVFLLFSKRGTGKVTPVFRRSSSYFFKPHLQKGTFSLTGKEFNRVVVKVRKDPDWPSLTNVDVSWYLYLTPLTPSCKRFPLRSLWTEGRWGHTPCTSECRWATYCSPDLYGEAFLRLPETLGPDFSELGPTFWTPLTVRPNRVHPNESDIFKINKQFPPV